jgi:hypothetical protein
MDALLETETTQGDVSERHRHETIQGRVKKSSIPHQATSHAPNDQRQGTPAIAT